MRARREVDHGKAAAALDPNLRLHRAGAVAGGNSGKGILMAASGIATAPPMNGTPRRALERQLSADRERRLIDSATLAEVLAIDTRHVPAEAKTIRRRSRWRSANMVYSPARCPRTRTAPRSSARALRPWTSGRPSFAIAMQRDSSAAGCPAACDDTTDRGERYVLKREIDPARSSPARSVSTRGARDVSRRRDERPASAPGSDRRDAPAIVRTRSPRRLLDRSAAARRPGTRRPAIHRSDRRRDRRSSAAEPRDT